MLFKNEKEKCFVYLSHTSCDSNNFILDFHITPGNIHDSVAFSDLYLKIKTHINNPISAIAIDAGYITPYISNPEECKNCVHIKKCTNSKNNQKVATRHI